MDVLHAAWQVESMPKSQEPAKKPEAKTKAAKAPVRHRVADARMPKELAPACQSLSRHIRDLHTACIYLGRTALDCFAWGAEAKKSTLKDVAAMPKDGVADLERVMVQVLGAKRAKDFTGLNRVRVQPAQTPVFRPRSMSRRGSSMPKPQARMQDAICSSAKYLRGNI